MRSTFTSAARLGLASLFALAAQASAAVFVVAHPDDDILLMGPNLINDIKGNYPTVIIVLTAGDAGNGALASASDPNYASSFNTGTTPYYRARLDARQAALATWIPSSYARPWVKTTVNLGNQTTQVEKVTLGNVTEYHLNLPDKIESNGYTTIENLLNGPGNMPDFSTYDVTGQNYYNVDNLKYVIRKIIKTNFPTEPTLVINYQEPVWRNVSYQPVARNDPGRSDHLDHTAVGQIVKQAIENVPAYLCMWQAIYYGYSEAANLSSPNSPNSVADQRAGYETLHQTLYNEGNITPITTGSVTGGTWGTTVPYTGNYVAGLQKGTMDAFHTNFYGKQIFYGVASTGSCNLGATPDL